LGGKVQLTYHKIARTEGDQRLLFPDYYQLVLPFQFLPPQKSNQFVLPASRTLAASTVARHGFWNPSNAFRFGDITVKNLWCQISSHTLGLRLGELKYTCQWQSTIQQHFKKETPPQPDEIHQTFVIDRLELPPMNKSPPPFSPSKFL